MQLCFLGLILNSPTYSFALHGKITAECYGKGRFLVESSSRVRKAKQDVWGVLCTGDGSLGTLCLPLTLRLERFIR